MTWHNFSPSSGDDHACTRCDLEVSDDALVLVAIDCPAPACSDATNTGACVLVLVKEGEDEYSEEWVECAYCGRSATLHETDEEDEDDG